MTIPLQELQGVRVFVIFAAFEWMALDSDDTPAPFFPWYLRYLTCTKPRLKQHMSCSFIWHVFFPRVVPWQAKGKGRGGGLYICWTLDTQLVRNGCKYNETLRAYIAYRQPLNQAGSPMFLVLPTGETPKSSGCRADIKAIDRKSVV